MKTWSDIRGQQRPKKILARAIETGRVHHAYLFTGLRGVGKFTTARAFAAVVDCEQRDPDRFEDACGECRSCRKIEQGYHPDVVTVAPESGASRIKIDQVRELQKSAAKQPHEGRFRMVLIDEAHEMTTEAANALLKTLEEPTARMRLILVTDRAHRLLETIVSRCQQLRFSGLEADDVREVLRRELEASDQLREMPDDETLRLAAEYGEGSVGRAVEIVTSGMLERRRELLEAVVDRPHDRPAPLLDLAEEFSEGAVDDRLDVLKVLFRDLMLYRSTGDDDRIVNRDLAEQIASHADRFSVDHLTDAVEELLEAQRQIDRHVSPQSVFEDLLPKLHPETR